MVESFYSAFTHLISSLSFLTSEQAFFEWFGQFAYQPNLVYLFVIVFMLASSFGLPIPEEVTLISTGLVTFMARHPEKYPPPFPGAPHVDLMTAANVAFFAVFFSDILVFSIGKFFGPRVTSSKFMQRFISPESMGKINGLAHKYSYWVCGIFRFTPGLRFPGHISCGMSGISYSKFLLIDGLAALISVPTQIFLVAHYGEDIIKQVKRFNAAIGIVVGVILIVFVTKKIIQHRRHKKSLNQNQT
ncbi:MAG: DedA family protein [Bacteriovoracaceae bacterium]